MRVLFLSTWFPYPPDQGSRIRAYHLLRAIAGVHEIALVSFEDRPLRPEWLSHVRSLCARVDVVREPPFPDLARTSWRAWLSRRPRAVVAGYSPAMEAEVRRVANSWKPEVVIALTFVTAPYAMKVVAARRIVDVDNLLAIMLKEEAEREHRWLQRLRRRIAYRKFMTYERDLFRRFDLCLVTSADDAERLQCYAGVGAYRVGVVPNGVDLDRFRPRDLEPNPLQLVFSGAMTYEPNLDAMVFFTQQVWPKVRTAIDGVQLVITGPTDGVELPETFGNGDIRLTGYLEDVRPVVAESAACIVPLRKGAGTRLKILEAMALGTPVISTRKGAEGLAVEPGVHLLIADEPDEFAQATIRLLQEPAVGRSLASNALRLVQQTYGWGDIGSRFLGMVEDRGPAL